MAATRQTKQTINGILALCGWFVLALALGMLYMPHVSPSRLSPCYYVFVLLPVVGAFRARRCVGRASIILSYGLVCGFVLALPVFLEPRLHLALGFGTKTVGGVVARIMAFAGATAVICLLVYLLGRLLAEYDIKPQERLPAWPVIPGDRQNGSPTGQAKPARKSNSAAG